MGEECDDYRKVEAEVDKLWDALQLEIHEPKLWQTENALKIKYEIQISLKFCSYGNICVKVKPLPT